MCIRDSIVDGVQNAPHRSLFHALGLTEEEQSRPLIGIVSSYNEIVPGHMNIDKLVEAVKLGVESKVLLEVNIGGEDSKTGFDKVAFSEGLSEIAELDTYEERQEFLAEIGLEESG